MPNDNTPQSAIDNLVVQSAPVADLQAGVDAALASAARAEATATATAAASGVPVSCACTVVQSGKSGDATFELPIGSTVTQALAEAGKSGAGCTIKKQTNGGQFMRVNNPDTSVLGAGSHYLLLTPKVAGGLR